MKLQRSFLVKINWSKTQQAVTKFLDVTLLFGAGALLDPSVHEFLGHHQGVATGVTIALVLLRQADKELGGKAASSKPSA